jgi:hypothetical protein
MRKESVTAKMQHSASRDGGYDSTPILLELLAGLLSCMMYEMSDLWHDQAFHG